MSQFLWLLLRPSQRREALHKQQWHDFPNSKTFSCCVSSTDRKDSGTRKAYEEAALLCLLAWVYPTKYPGTCTWRKWRCVMTRADLPSQLADLISKKIVYLMLSSNDMERLCSRGLDASASKPWAGFLQYDRAPFWILVQVGLWENADSDPGCRAKYWLARANSCLVSLGTNK